MHNTNAISCVFDASHVIWSFIKAIIEDNANEILYTDAYCQLSCAVDNRDKFALSEETVWINVSDKTYLVNDAKHEKFYDTTCKYYIFDNMSIMFRFLDHVYTTILNMPRKDEASLNCVMSYQNRYSNIKKTIHLVENKVVMDQMDAMMSCMHL